MNVSELRGQVLVTALILHLQASDEWNVGNGKVNASVLYLGLLEALDVNLGIRIEQRKNATCRVINLYGMNIATVADFCRHLGKDISDTCRAFQDGSTLESQLCSNIPKGINNMRRCVERTVCTHHRLLVSFIAQQLA